MPDWLSTDFRIRIYTLFCNKQSLHDQTGDRNHETMSFYSELYSIVFAGLNYLSSNRKYPAVPEPNLDELVQRNNR